MQEFDVLLKLLLQGAIQTLSQLAGTTIARWLPTELPHLQNPRLDLLGQAAADSLVHVECQSTNDGAMPLRMAEYSLGVYRQYRQFPFQLVLYVGRQRMRMAGRLPAPFESFHYHAVDLRTVDSEPLLASPAISDNVLGILARLSGRKRAVARIVRRIAEESDAGQRACYLEALLRLAGLRNLEGQVEEEARKVPILNDILENKVLGREYRRGLQEGLQEGKLALLGQLIEQRFGPMPDWASQRLSHFSEVDLQALGSRLFEAKTLEELLRS